MIDVDALSKRVVTVGPREEIEVEQPFTGGRLGTTPACTAEDVEAAIERAREAQRAWVAFRDASRPFGMEACLRITGHRTTQLNDFYIRGGTSAVQATKAQEKPDPTIPNPFERAK